MLSSRGVRVMALARRVAPLEVARRMGAIATINVTQVHDVVAAVRNLTEDQRGADSVVEAAGNPPTSQQALAMVRRGGVVNFFSRLPSPTPAQLQPAPIPHSTLHPLAPFPPPPH